MTRPAWLQALTPRRLLGAAFLLSAGMLLTALALRGRAELLAFMWGPPFTASGLIAGAIALLAVCFAGMLGFWLSRSPALAAVSAFALVAGLAGSWALLTPPLQAPDEAAHFRGFFDDPFPPRATRPDVLAWANAMHFERIKFRRAEGFNETHRAAPLTGTWAPHVGTTSMQSRSPLTYGAWKILAERHADAGLSAGTWLFLLRGANALALSLAFLIACLAILRTGGAHRRAGPCVAFLAPLLLIPTFVFFSVHASNYGFLTAGLVIFCAGLFLTLQDRGRSSFGDGVAGILLGAGLAVSILSSRSALPLLSVLAVLSLTRGLIEPVRLKETASFWIATGLTLLAALQCPGAAAYLDQFAPLLGSLLPISATSAAPPWPALLAFALASMAGIEAALQVGRRGWSNTHPAKSATPVIVVCGAIAAAVLSAANVSPGPLADNEIASPLVGLDYARPVMIRFLDQLFPLSKPDFLLATSFWGGFGWLDRLLPDPVVFVLKMVPLLALFACAVLAATRPSLRTVFLKAAMYFAAALVLVAVSAYVVSRFGANVPGRPPAVNLHGRFLIAPYLMLMLPAMSVLQAGLQARNGLGPGLLAGVLVVHAGLLCWLLNAYFF